MKANDVKELKALRKENQQLKRIVADQQLGNLALREISRGKLLSLARKRLAVNHLIDRFDTSERRACRITDQSRSTQRRLLVIADQELELRSWLVLFAKRRLCAQTGQRGLTDFVMGADATSAGLGGRHNRGVVMSAP